MPRPGRAPKSGAPAAAVASPPTRTRFDLLMRLLPGPAAGFRFRVRLSVSESGPGPGPRACRHRRRHRFAGVSFDSVSKQEPPPHTHTHTHRLCPPRTRHGMPAMHGRAVSGHWAGLCTSRGPGTTRSSETLEAPDAQKTASGASRRILAPDAQETNLGRRREPPRRSGRAFGASPRRAGGLRGIRRAVTSTRRNRARAPALKRALPWLIPGKASETVESVICCKSRVPHTAHGRAPKCGDSEAAAPRPSRRRRPPPPARPSPS